MRDEWRISTEEVKDGEQHDEESLWGTGRWREVDDLLEDEEEESLIR
jgi:hypothetical protein